MWVGGLSFTYLTIFLAVHLALHKSTVELASYRTMIASISGRIHESMSQSEINHVTAQIEKIEFGGDLGSLGLDFIARPLSIYIEPASFDMNASLALLGDDQLTAAQVKFDSLSSKVDLVYARRTGLLDRLLQVACLVGLSLLFFGIWFLFKSNSRWQDEISIVENFPADGDSGFEKYLQSVIDEEVQFVGHRARLSCKGFDIDHLPLELKEIVELLAEQLVRNSIEHGGRPAEVRLLAGKTDYVSVRVILQELESSWVLSVWDNGEGLDGNEILRTALRLNLISEENANSLEAEQRIKLVFLQGFTTREVDVSTTENNKPLSELRAISKRIGGTISIQNQRGDYCQFSVRFQKRVSSKSFVGK
jgi:hypothetical protein